jgi:hypothetical protein
MFLGKARQKGTKVFLSNPGLNPMSVVLMLPAASGPPRITVQLLN